jgi:transcription antitermination factor NusG
MMERLRTEIGPIGDFRAIETIDAHRMHALWLKTQESAGSIDQRALSCGSRGGRRWFCVWTHPQDEHRALHSIAGAGFEVYLPLHLERDRYRHQRVVPLFPRYLFPRFDAQQDAWGAIAHCRGVGGLIRQAAEHPVALPDAVIDELLARTSARGIVDDPGDARPVEAPHGVKRVWRSITALSAQDRCRVLCRLFGEGVIREDAA